MSDLPGWVHSESERTGRGPTVRKAWAALGCAVGGAFFVGALVSGWVGDRIIAVIIGAPIFLLASVGFLVSMGERVGSASSRAWRSSASRRGPGSRCPRR